MRRETNRLLSPEPEPTGGTPPAAPVAPVAPPAPDPRAGVIPEPSAPPPVLSPVDYTQPAPKIPGVTAPPDPTVPVVISTVPTPQAPAPAEPSARELELQAEIEKLKLERLRVDPFAFDEAPASAEPAAPVFPTAPAFSTAPATPIPPSPPASLPQPVAPQTPWKISDEDFDKVFDNADSFSNAVNTAVQQIVGGQTLASETLLKQVDQLVDRRLQTLINVDREVTGFFTENKDLEPHRETIEIVAQGIRRERPGLGTLAVLKEAGSRVRKIVRSQATPPGLTPPVGPTSRGAPQPTGLQKDMQRLFGN